MQARVVPPAHCGRSETSGHCGGCGRYVRWSVIAGRYARSNELTGHVEGGTDRFLCPGEYEFHWPRTPSG